MEFKRLNSEKKLTNENFKLKIGTTNKTNPQVIYVEGRAFISPTFESDDYIGDVNNVRHSFKQSITHNLRNNDLFDNKFIVDFQVASNRMALNKKSFLSFQFIMKQNPAKIYSLKEIALKTKPMVDDIVNSLSNKLNEYDFVIYKNKK